MTVLSTYFYLNYKSDVLKRVFNYAYIFLRSPTLHIFFSDYWKIKCSGMGIPMEINHFKVIPGELPQLL